MATDSKPATFVRPRFVPTLTEVVDPDEAGGDAGSSLAALAPTNVRLGVTAEQVLAMLGPRLDQRIAEAIVQAVDEQLQGLQARVRRSVGDAVQDAVDAALRETADPARPEADPQIGKVGN